jgi:predicted nucleotide-binding protein
MSLLQDFRINASLLEDAGWEGITPRLVGLLKWMSDQPGIRTILEDLKSKAPVYEELNRGRPQARSQVVSSAATPRDVAAVGLAMMEECARADEPRPLFHQVAYSFGMQAPPNQYLPHEFLCDAALKRYIRPLLDYVIRELPEEQPTEPTVAVSRDQLTFEFLKELFDEHERDPLPTHWVRLDDIWKRVVEKYGDSLSSELATAAFNHLYAGRLINQINGPANAKNIQINERGIVAYQQMNAHRLSPTPSSTLDPQTVFVVHGRNLAARNSMFEFLRAIGLKPLEWSQAISATGEATPYIGQVLDTAFSIAQAVVVLMTPDDEACLRTEFQIEEDPEYERQPTGQARPNVLFEAGMALGRNPKRTVLVEIGTLRPFSDVGGRHVLRLDNSTKRRQDLAERLGSAGCAIVITGRDWHTVGSFEIGSASPQTLRSDTTASRLDWSLKTLALLITCAVVTWLVITHQSSQLSERTVSMICLSLVTVVALSTVAALKKRQRLFALILIWIGSAVFLAWLAAAILEYSRHAGNASTAPLRGNLTNQPRIAQENASSTNGALLISGKSDSNLSNVDRRGSPTTNAPSGPIEQGHLIGGNSQPRTWVVPDVWQRRRGVDYLETTNPPPDVLPDDERWAVGIYHLDNPSGHHEWFVDAPWTTGGPQGRSTNLSTQTVPAHTFLMEGTLYSLRTTNRFTLSIFRPQRPQTGGSNTSAADSRAPITNGPEVTTHQRGPHLANPLMDLSEPHSILDFLTAFQTLSD